MLITSICFAAALQSGGTEIRLARYPSVSGDSVAFVYASDIWLSDRRGGPARRLTSHPGGEGMPKFSPDGKMIAFLGQYDGGQDVYVMPAEGGAPKRLTHDPNNKILMGWTPDGKVAYSSTAGNLTNRMLRMWLVSPQGGMPEWTPVPEAFNASFSPDGTKMAYNRSGSFNFNWRRYRGGTQGKVSFWDFKTNTYSEVPAGREQNYFPMWVGDSVYFISDKTQQNLNLYRYDVGSKRVEQVTKFNDGDIKWPSTDGKTIVWERNGRIESFDIASKTVTGFTPKVLSDETALRPRYTAVSGYVDSMALSPSGKRFAVTARGEAFSVPARNGETRNLSNTQGARETGIDWSPDGESVAFISDRSGEDRIYIEPQTGGTAEEVKIPAGHSVRSFNFTPKGSYILYEERKYGWYLHNLKTGATESVVPEGVNQARIDVSADEKWIAYTKPGPNLLANVYFYEVATKKTTKAFSGDYDSSPVAFDLSGKYLYLVSSRTFGYFPTDLEVTLAQKNTARVYAVPLSADATNPLLPESDEEPGKEKPAKPEAPSGTKVDFDGMEQRMFPLPYPPGQYGGLIGINNGVLVFGANGSTIFNFASRTPQPFLQSFGNLTVNAARTKALYTLGDNAFIVDVKPNVQPGEGRASMAEVGYVLDPAAEWKQIFWETWRYERDEYYDKDMLGMDWKAIGAKYAALLPSVGHRADLQYILGLLIGELGTGHSYLQAPPELGADLPNLPQPSMLGADYEVVDGKIRFKRILRGNNYMPSANAPLGAPGVHVQDGEYLLAINGTPVDAKTGIGEALLGKAGKDVVLTVGKTTDMASARKVTVRPLANESSLRYETWVDERKAYVEKLSGGRVGYMHVPDTSLAGITGFVRGLTSQAGKEAMVIDERYNGGGFIPTFFVEYLQRKANSVVAPRHGELNPLPNNLEGPMVMLINQHAGSGGDMFPYLFKRAGLGPLVGRRTWGGLVGINGYHRLVDGSGVTAPGFGIYDPDTKQWIAENRGVDPDVEIDDRPDLLAKGEDSQLKAAVEMLMKKLPATPKKLVRPDFPTVGKGGN